MKKVFVKGPFLTQSGYGHHARTLLRALRTREDLFDIYLHPINWGKTSWIWEDSEERKWIDSLLQKTIAHATESNNQPEYDVSVQVTIPNEWEKLAPINIGVTAGIETTQIAPNWIEKSFLMDKILTISKHAVNSFVNTVYQATNNQTGQQFSFKCEKPVECIHYPVRQVETKKLNLDLTTDFNFLCVAQLSPRKNAEQLIKCFVDQFKDNDNVGLIIKANIAKNSLIDRANMLYKLKQFLASLPERKCKIYLLHGFLSEEEMSGLYTHPKVKALVSATHGEGFGLPLFEAAYNALPVIATDWSGHLDFLYMPQKQKNGKQKNKHMFSKISYTLGPVSDDAVWEGVLMKESMWAYPEEGSIKMALEDMYKDHGRFKKRAKQLQKWVTKEFSQDKINNQYIEAVYGEKPVDISDLPRVSIITSIYNGDEYIEQFMDDITSQTIFEEKCELVLIDANSPGNEEEIINPYLEKYPNNIVYKKLDEDPGIYAVWNMGVEMASGEYVTNANLDDRHAPYAYEKQAAALLANPDVDLVYADMLITDKSNETWAANSSNGRKYNFPEFSYEHLKMVNMPHAAPMWRKSLHKKHGLFDEKYNSAGDWEMWLRAAQKGSKFMKMSTPVGLYYFNPTGISTNPDNFSWKREEEKEVFEKYSKLEVEVEDN